MIDWGAHVGNVGGNQYGDRISRLKTDNIDTTSIEKTVTAAIMNYKSGMGRSFVIFGEPQSGKTEMMIALNARLLDEGCDVIINLLTDSVDLLGQSLTRFRGAGLSPSPKQFDDLPDDPKNVAKKQWVLFSKKNARDLEKLIEALRFVKSLVVIDDEADYASPNSKVNSDERTKINKLIYDLLENRGNYIGVTATPARLDLNNTFENVSEMWVDFEPHSKYVGQDFFFPDNGLPEYRLKLFDAEEGKERIELRNAIFHFLCGVAELNLVGNGENFTMLVHTSGKIDEHSDDLKVIHDTLNILSSADHPCFSTYVSLLLRTAENFEGEKENLVKYILNNIFRHQIVLINSKGKKSNAGDILKPAAPFSFGVGGNIVSRGVTFENLLSMYFTRSVKGKFTQDTYIQRARMFGNREKYKNKFQLWVPEVLMQNWGKCFAFHKLAIQSIRSDVGAPVWLADHKTTPTSPASIDRSSVDFEGGVMSWALFNYDSDAHEALMLIDGLTDMQKLARLRTTFSNSEFPEHVYKYLCNEASIMEQNICFHSTGEIGIRSRSYSDEEIKNVRRTRKGSFFSTNEFRRGNRENARHHLKIFRNALNKARLFYAINGGSIRFIQNVK